MSKYEKGHKFTPEELYNPVEADKYNKIMSLLGAAHEPKQGYEDPNLDNLINIDQNALVEEPKNYINSLIKKTRDNPLFSSRRRNLSQGNLAELLNDPAIMDYFSKNLNENTKLPDNFFTISSTGGGRGGEVKYHYNRLKDFATKNPELFQNISIDNGPELMKRYEKLSQKDILKAILKNTKEKSKKDLSEPNRKLFLNQLNNLFYTDPTNKTEGNKLLLFPQSEYTDASSADTKKVKKMLDDYNRYLRTTGVDPNTNRTSVGDSFYNQGKAFDINTYSKLMDELYR